MESLFVGSFPKPNESSLPTRARLSRFRPHSVDIMKNSFCPLMRNQQEPLSLPHVECCGDKFSHHFYRPKTRYATNAVPISNPDQFTGPASPTAESPMKPMLRAFDIFYRFWRPFASMPTGLCTISVSFLAVEKLSDFSAFFFIKMLQAVFAGFFMQLYIVGFNQLTDVEIDKVNKPYLPLATGEISIKTGATIVSLSAIMSFSLAWISGSWPLFWTLFIWFALGTAYSINLPLLRWKRFSLTTVLSVFAARALVIPIGFYLHVQTNILGRPPILSKPVIFATTIFSFFTVFKALFKDISDIEGDLKYGTKSLASQIGPKRMFWSCVWFLEMGYALTALVGLSSSSLWSKYITVLGHAVMAFVLWTHAKSVDLKNKEAIRLFYVFVWKLYSAEMLLIPFVR